MILDMISLASPYVGSLRSYVGFEVGEKIKSTGEKPPN